MFYLVSWRASAAGDSRLRATQVPKCGELENETGGVPKDGTLEHRAGMQTSGEPENETEGVPKDGTLEHGAGTPALLRATQVRAYDDRA